MSQLSSIKLKSPPSYWMKLPPGAISSAWPQHAHQAGVTFRPHFKTHQSAEIGEWFRAAGVTAITVSSVDMALYFARHGWNDITIAFPANLRQQRDLAELARQIHLGLLVESVETVQHLASMLDAPAGPVDQGRCRRAPHRAALGSARAGRAGRPAAPRPRIPCACAGCSPTPGKPTARAGKTRSAGATAKASRASMGCAAPSQQQGLGPLAVSVGDTPGDQPVRRSGRGG